MDNEEEKIIGLLEISIKQERSVKTFSEWSINLCSLVIGFWLGHFFTLSVDVKCNAQLETQPQTKTQPQTEKGNSNASNYSNQYPRL